MQANFVVSRLGNFSHLSLQGPYGLRCHQAPTHARNPEPICGGPPALPVVKHPEVKQARCRTVASQTIQCRFNPAFVLSPHHQVTIFIDELLLCLTVRIMLSAALLAVIIATFSIYRPDPLPLFHTSQARATRSKCGMSPTCEHPLRTCKPQALLRSFEKFGT